MPSICAAKAAIESPFISRALFNLNLNISLSSIVLDLYSGLQNYKFYLKHKPSIRKNFIIFESLLFEPVNEDRPAGISGEDPPALIVAVGVVRQAHCAGELSDDGGEGCLDSVLGDDVEIVEGDEKFVELGLLACPFER